MEIQDLNVGVFQDGMGRIRDEIVRGTAQPRVCACVLDNWQSSCRIVQEAGAEHHVILSTILISVLFYLHDSILP